MSDSDKRNLGIRGFQKGGIVYAKAGQHVSKESALDGQFWRESRGIEVNDASKGKGIRRATKEGWNFTESATMHGITNATGNVLVQKKKHSDRFGLNYVQNGKQHLTGGHYASEGRGLEHILYQGRSEEEMGTSPRNRHGILKSTIGNTEVSAERAIQAGAGMFVADDKRYGNVPEHRYARTGMWTGEGGEETGIRLLVDGRDNQRITDGGKYVQEGEALFEREVGAFMGQGRNLVETIPRMLTQSGETRELFRGKIPKPHGDRRRNDYGLGREFNVQSRIRSGLGLLEKGIVYRSDGGVLLWRQEEVGYAGKDIYAKDKRHRGVTKLLKMREGNF